MSLWLDCQGTVQECMSNYYPISDRGVPDCPYSVPPKGASYGDLQTKDRVCIHFELVHEVDSLTPELSNTCKMGPEVHCKGQKIRQNLTLLSCKLNRQLLPKDPTPHSLITLPSGESSGEGSAGSVETNFQSAIWSPFANCNIGSSRSMYTVPTYLQVWCLIVPNSLKNVPEIFNFKRNPN